MQTSNKKCRSLVEGRITFKASHVFAEEYKGYYVVFSYGYHFPMYVYENHTGKWFGNKDKYSVSTSRQQSQSRPSSVEIIWLSTQELKDKIYLAERVR